MTERVAPQEGRKREGKLPFFTAKKDDRKVPVVLWVEVGSTNCGTPLEVCHVLMGVLRDCIDSVRKGKKNNISLGRIKL